MFSEKERFDEFYEYLNGSSIGTVWLAMLPENVGREHLSFKQKKDFFIEFLSILLQKGKIRIGKNGRFLNGSIEEQLNQFRLKMPKSEVAWNTAHEETWFFDDECPGGIVWISESGYEDWT